MGQALLQNGFGAGRRVARNLPGINLPGPICHICQATTAIMPNPCGHCRCQFHFHGSFRAGEQTRTTGPVPIGTPRWEQSNSVCKLDGRSWHSGLPSAGAHPKPLQRLVVRKDVPSTRGTKPFTTNHLAASGWHLVPAMGSTFGGTSCPHLPSMVFITTACPTVGMAVFRPATGLGAKSGQEHHQEDVPGIPRLVEQNRHFPSEEKDAPNAPNRRNLFQKGVLGHLPRGLHHTLNMSNLFLGGDCLI